ncbi:hypothetical protein BKI52_05280 [marine bacterium AO1-C]|nr:hypothetical protein BKI52_05280 [marine bacterium AO1-C]
MNKFILTIIGVLSITTLQAQQLIKCDSSTTYWVIAQDKTHYTLKLNGKIQTTPRKTLVVVNTNALQYLLLDKQPYAKAAEKKGDLRILIKQATKELEFFSAQFKKQLKAQMQKIVLDNKKEALLWWYEMPEGMNESIIQQVFLSVVINDKILGVASVQAKDQKFEDIKGFLVTVLNTLKEVRSKRKLKKICKY